MASCEHNDLIGVFEGMQDIFCPGPDVDSSLGRFTLGKLDGDFDVVGVVDCLVAVDKGFIHVEHYGLFLLVALPPRQI